ncbi:MAG: rhodanese-like domain-containing protein [Oligoflexia bacterium]|nr:rhodanese-like domain-containing protein [Oligoflexia bacterium]
MRIRNIFVIALLLLGCTRTTPVSTVSPREVDGLLRNDFAVLLDVREESEIKAEGMADRALWFPSSKIEANDPSWREFLGKLPRDKQIVIYCRSGRRSGLAADKLAKEGFRVSNMGAFQDWVKAGLPVKKNGDQGAPDRR